MISLASRLVSSELFNNSELIFPVQRRCEKINEKEEKKRNKLRKLLVVNRHWLCFEILNYG
jgi:hypothetical protein